LKTRDTNKQDDRPGAIESMTLTAPLKSVLLALPLVLCTAGCSEKAKAGIPTEAQRVLTGKGQLVYKFDRGGEVYVLDATEKKIVWKDFLREGDTLTVAPDGDFIAIGLQTVSEPDLDLDHKYSVYLRRD
jgi:hypothetical protein